MINGDKVFFYMANIGWRTERINAVSDFGLCWLRYRRLAELQNQRPRELFNGVASYCFDGMKVSNVESS